MLLKVPVLLVVWSQLSQLSQILNLPKKTLFTLKIPYFDCIVTTADQLARSQMVQTKHGSNMTTQCFYAFSTVDVPNFDGPVERTAY